MGILDNTSKITNKFIIIVICLTAILLIFTLIIGLGVILSKPSSNHGGTVPGTSETLLPGVPATYADKLLPDQTLADGSTYVTMARAAGIVMASDAGTAWSREHPDCELYQAEADLIDVQGLAYRWSVIFRANGSMLMADVEDGHAANVQSQDMEGLEVSPVSPERIYDSKSIMGILSGNLSISVQPGNMQFSLKYDVDECKYHASYNDPSSPTPYDFSMDAVSGSIIESNYRGPA